MREAAACFRSSGRLFMGERQAGKCCMVKTGERLGRLKGSLRLPFPAVSGPAAALVLPLHRVGSIKIAKVHEADTP
jgi:hypothetical protein